LSTKTINAVYQQGTEQADPFTFYWENLRPLLWKYARAIGNQQKNYPDDHMISEMVDDLLMKITTYNGTSAFSSWVYTVFKHKFIDGYRYLRGNLGNSLESLQEDWEKNQPEDSSGANPYEPSTQPTRERDVIVAEFVDTLAPRQRIVWEMYRDGHTQVEIGESLGIRQQSVDEIWQRILRLGEQYGKQPVKR
jgi:RNA polymerase sigma factor (sigma-70 family)